MSSANNYYREAQEFADEGVRLLSRVDGLDRLEVIHKIRSAASQLEQAVRSAYLLVGMLEAGAGDGSGVRHTERR